MRYRRQASPTSKRQEWRTGDDGKGPAPVARTPRLQPGSDRPLRTSTQQVLPSLDEPGPECQKSPASRPSPQWARSSRYAGRHTIIGVPQACRTRGRARVVPISELVFGTLTQNRRSLEPLGFAPVAGPRSIVECVPYVQVLEEPKRDPKRSWRTR